jgi:hypothetical protein
MKASTKTRIEKYNKNMAKNYVFEKYTYQTSEKQNQRKEVTNRRRSQPAVGKVTQGRRAQ